MVWRAFGAGEGRPPQAGIVRHWFEVVGRSFRAGDLVNTNPGLTPGAMVWRAFGAGEGQPPEVGIVRHWFEVV